MSEFVSFQIAKKLKEKGFDYPCVGHYVNDQLYIAHYQNAFHSDKDESLDAPTISQVLKWLRERKGIHITICVCGYGWFYEVIHISSGKSLIEDYEDDMLQSYEDATIAGIEYVINNLI